MSVPKLSLNLNEENELAFKISIEGSSSDIGATKPRFRLFLSENNNEQGMIYPAKQGEDGCVVVRLPNNRFFSEEVNYRGKLEVILGNHYFVPTEVDIEFIKPLKVEAVVVTNQDSTLREEKLQKDAKQTSVSVSTVEVRNRKKINEVSKPVKSKNRTWDDLSESEQERVFAHLKEKKIQELKKQKLLQEKRKKTKQQSEAKLEARFKDQLKDLMSNSLLDE